MNSATAFPTLLCALMLSDLVAAAVPDAAAQAKCGQLHPGVAIFAPDTEYLNQQCLLNCRLTSGVYAHFMNEGLECPLTSSGKGYCHQGDCVTSLPTGHVDIELISASVSISATMYSTVCIQNNSAPISLPLADRSACVSCSSPLSPEATFTVWDSVCTGSGDRVFSDSAQVTFEVWQSHGTGAENKIFLGGASLTVPQLISHGDSGKVLHLPLTNGHVAGQINARVTWTPTKH